MSGDGRKRTGDDRAAQPTRLRGHHLLCLLTYVGRGYDAGFVANMDALARRLSVDGRVVVVSGPDDICGPIRDAPDAHCREPRIDRRDRAALRDVSAHLGRSLVPGDRLKLDAATIARLRAAFAAGAIRSACSECQWHGLCTGVAGEGYAGGRLDPAGADGPGRG